VKKLPSVETFVPLFGWVSAGPTEAHSYLWPKVKKSLPRRTGLKILDLRSGNGYLASKPSELGHVVIGVVASPDGVEIARKSYPNVRFELRSVYDDLADLGSGFDVVLSSEVIEHLYDPKALIIKAYAALRRGSAPAHDSLPWLHQKSWPEFIERVGWTPSSSSRWRLHKVFLKAHHPRLDNPVRVSECSRRWCR